MNPVIYDSDVNFPKISLDTLFLPKLSIIHVPRKSVSITCFYNDRFCQEEINLATTQDVTVKIE